MIRKFNFLLVFLISLTSFLFCQEEPLIPEEIEETPHAYVIGPGIVFPDSLSESDEKEILKQYTENAKKYLQILKEYNKQEYYQYLNRNRFNLYNIAETYSSFSSKNERAKKILELDIQTEALGAKYQKVKDSDKTKVKEELKKNLYELFELKESERKEEYEQLRKKLDELKETLEERQKFREEIVKRKMEELIGESKHIRW